MPSTRSLVRLGRTGVSAVICLVAFWAAYPSAHPVASAAAAAAARPAADQAPKAGVAPVASSEKPNYDLAAAWTSQKVGKLVFDSSVTPRWLETTDRFWYSFQTRDGRKFYLVDPAKKSRTLLFDHAKMASELTAITMMPYEAQHLPFTTVKFVRKDAAFQFDVAIPRDADYIKPKKAAAEAPPAAPPKTDGVVKKDARPAEELGAEDQGAQQGQRGGQQQGQRGGAPAAPAPPRNRTLHFEFDVATSTLTLLDDDYKAPRRPRWASPSPDGKTVVFARNHNLFMMDGANFALAQKKADDPAIVEVQLTKDGEDHYSYARTVQPGGQQQQEQQDDQQQAENEQESTDKNARVAAIAVTWSRDSKKFAVIRRDERKVNDLWVIDALAMPRPKLETYRYAMPGEANIPLPEMIVFDRESKAAVKVKADKFKDQSLQIAQAPVPARLGAGGGGGIGAAGGATDRPEPQWLSDSNDKLYFTRMSRDLHRLDVCVATPDTGDVKVLVEERLNTYIETKPLRLVDSGRGLVLWSERTGWGHFYLYDAVTGALKNAITSGEYVVTGFEGIDEKPAASEASKGAHAAGAPAVVFFTAAGREANEDPYYPHLYRVNLDGTGLKLLNPADANHATALADSNKYFVDNVSRVDAAPTSSLYDTTGALVAKLETTDIGPLQEAGFKFPEPFKVKADDGVTDLFGVMYKPYDFDPARKYPVILYVYPGPQTESVTKTFNPRGTSSTLAQYGFIVVEVGNRGGNPSRSKWYHNYGYGNLRDYGLADKKAAVEQLARKYAYVDINRVGIWGHSGGGFMTAAALLVYPDFFKVGWSESGNHENNIYNNTWSEKHHGIKEVADKDGNVTFEYGIEKNSELAKNLKGHLALVTGDIDNNVHPANTIRLADALIKANKRFDFFMVPGQRHSYGVSASWVNMMRADYFCRYLLGQAADSVDIPELNREREQTGDKRTIR